MKILTILGVLALVWSSTEGVTVTVEETCANNVATTFYAYTTKSSGKLLNETCSATSECGQTRGPVVCANAMCKCAPGYSPYPYMTAYTNNVSVTLYGCQTSPGINQVCTDDCRWPLKCVDGPGYSTMTQMPSTPSPSPNATRYPGAPPPRKTCQCVEPFKQLSSGSCVIPCGDNEVQLPSLECKPIVNVGDDCEASQQCSAQFSKCENKKCVCHAGLRADGGTCVIATARCEYGGEPLRPSGASSDAAPVSCTVRFSTPAGTPIYSYMQVPVSSPLSTVASTILNGPGGPLVTEGCPSDHYCSPYESHNGVTGEASGLCCPFPRPYCPIGEPHPSANCSVRSVYGYNVNGVPPSVPEDNPDICPTNTHVCVPTLLLREATCCPRACPIPYVLVGQKCVPPVEIDSKCKSSDQCVLSNSECINGVCTCPAKTIRSNQPTGLGCTPSCDYQLELIINGRCQPRLKIGDQCRGQETRCPLSAVCNSAGTCQCSCGLVALDGKICSQPPYCPPVKRTTGGTTYRPTARPTKDELEKTVFCRTSTAGSWADAAATCPENQYCYSYTTGLGVCCDQPEPFCPYNENVYEKCDMQPIVFNGGTTAAPTNCKADQFCYSYFSSSGNATKTGVCCDKYVPPPPTTRIYPSPTTNNIIYQYTTPRSSPPMTPAVVAPGNPSVQILPAVAPAVQMTPGPSPVPVTGQ